MHARWEAISAHCWLAWYSHGASQTQVFIWNPKKSPVSAPAQIALCSQQPRDPNSLCGKSSPFPSPQCISWIHCSRLLGSDHRFYIWSKQAVSENRVALGCTFPVNATLPKGLLAEDLPQFRPEGVHVHLWLHWPHKPLFFKDKRKILARTWFNIRYGYMIFPRSTRFLHRNLTFNPLKSPPIKREITS